MRRSARLREIQEKRSTKSTTRLGSNGRRRMRFDWRSSDQSDDSSSSSLSLLVLSPTREEEDVINEQDSESDEDDDTTIDYSNLDQYQEENPDLIGFVVPDDAPIAYRRPVSRAQRRADSKRLAIQRRDVDRDLRKIHQTHLDSVINSSPRKSFEILYLWQAHVASGKKGFPPNVDPNLILDPSSRPRQLALTWRLFAQECMRPRHWTADTFDQICSYPHYAQAPLGDLEFPCELCPNALPKERPDDHNPDQNRQHQDMYLCLLNEREDQHGAGIQVVAGGRCHARLVLFHLLWHFLEHMGVRANSKQDPRSCDQEFDRLNVLMADCHMFLENKYMT